MIQEEEFEVVGYVKKTCVCDNCIVEMEKQPFVHLTDPAQYVMKCPKCHKEESILCEELNGQWKLIKKVK